ncbi:MAG: AcrR family transcriptional regulator [Thermoproteota archaeon]|jgi:AcrR family transcriptional regulator
MTTSSRKRLSAQDRKNSIIKASIPFFAQNGYKSTTTKEIAHAAGISEALLFKYFASKENLYQKIQIQLCHKSQSLAQNLTQMDAGVDKLIISVTVLAYSILMGFDDQEEFELTHKLILNSLSSEGVFAKEFFDNHFVPWIPYIKENLNFCNDQDHFYEDFKVDDFDIWIWQHLFYGIAQYNFKESDFFKYEIKMNELLERSILFCLRGMGLKNEIIKEHYNYQLIIKKIQEIKYLNNTNTSRELQ